MANDQLLASLALLTGIANGVQDAQRRRQAEEVQKLLLFSKMPGYELAPAGAEAQPANWLSRLLGQDYRPTSAGMPVVGVGGTPVVARPEGRTGDTALWQALMGGGAGTRPATAPGIPAAPNRTQMAMAPGGQASLGGLPNAGGSTPAEPTLEELVRTDRRMQSYRTLPKSEGVPLMRKRLDAIESEMQEAAKDETKTLRAAKSEALRAARSSKLPVGQQKALLQQITDATSIEALDALQPAIVQQQGTMDYGDDREAVAKQMFANRSYADLDSGEARAVDAAIETRRTQRVRGDAAATQARSSADKDKDATFALRKEIIKAYRASGEKVPATITDPSLSKEQLLEAYAASPAKGDEAEDILRDLGSVQANITKQLEGGTDALTGLFMEKLGTLDVNSPEKRQRDMTLKTYRQRGLLLAKKLRTRPGMEAIAEAYIQEFEGLLAPPTPDAAAPPTPAAPAAANTARWYEPWKKMGETGTLGGTPSAAPKVKSFRQLE